MYKKLSVLIVVFFLFIYILPLGLRPLHVPDETRYGEIAREMVVSGDWVVPRLCGLRYFEKPAMGYWLNAASIKLFGVNNFAVRLPTALATGLSALIIFLLLKGYGGGRKTAITGVAVFLTSTLVFVLGIYVVLDGMLAFMLTAAMASFFVSYCADKIKKKIFYLVLFGLFCAFAFLIKGFLAFVVPVVVIIPFLLLEKEWKKIFTLPWLPLIVVLVVVAPWSFAIYHREPDFWHYFFWEEHVRRFLASNAQHNAPFWYYIPVLIVGSMPWFFFLPAAISGMVKRHKTGILEKYALCWFIFPFLFFSISKGKLGTYILPVFPPLIILYAIGIRRYFDNEGRKLFNIGAILSSIFAIGFSCAILWAPLHEIKNIELSNYVFLMRWVLFVVMLGWGISMVTAIRVKVQDKKLLYISIAPMLLFFILHLSSAGIHIKKHAPGKFINKYVHEIPDNAMIVSDNHLGPAVSWYLNDPKIYFLEGKGELKYGLSYADAARRFLTFDDLKRAVLRYKVPAVLIITTSRLRKFGNHLPDAEVKHSESGYVMLFYNCTMP